MNIAELTAHAVRLHDRYLLEIVEPFGLCPWARRARLDGHTLQHVITHEDQDAAIAATLQVMKSWQDELQIEVAFVIFPRIVTTRPMFDRFVARVSEGQAQMHELGHVPFVMAGFHPESRVDDSTPERLIPFLRRTPDPCIQIVRSKVLDAVRENTPQGTSFVDAATFDLENMKREVPLRERIAKANLATVKKIGFEEITRLLEDIRADRERTYAALR